MNGAQEDAEARSLARERDEANDTITRLEAAVRDLSDGNQNLYHQRETLKTEVAELKDVLRQASKVLYPSKRWMADEWRDRGLLEE